MLGMPHRYFGSLRNAASVVAVVVALAGAPAIAQVAEGEKDATPVSDPQQDGGLQEIIVTAQRREENLQRVPISVAAVTADTLANTGITSTNSLPQLVPSIQLGRSGPSGLLFIRGVGNTGAQTGEEGSNALYVDGVYLADLPQAVQDFSFVQRVEVLKGPQGTLFGRNASGGVVNIVTKDPGSEFVVDAKLGYGNYQTYTGQAYVAVPINDSLSADVAFNGTDQNEGWGRNLTTGKDVKLGWAWGVRSKIVWQAADIVKIKLAGDYNRSRDSFGLGWRLEDGYLGSDGNTVSPGGQNTLADFPQYTELKIYGVSATAEVDLGGATLTNIAAYRHNRTHSNLDVDASPTALLHQVINGDQTSYQEELRVASKTGGPISWQAGIFYLRSEAALVPQEGYGAFLPAATGFQYADLKTRSFAVFGELTYALTPTTHVTAGLRHTTDHRELTASTVPVGTPNPANPLIKPAPLDYAEFTYRAAIRQDITPSINVYASYNRGFKAGIWSLSAPTQPPVKPTFTDAFEAGFKSEFFNRKVRFNVSAYHYNISDYQVRTSAVIPGVTSLFNAATVKVDGLDVDFEVAPVRALRIFGGATFLNSRFGRFPGAPYAYPNPAVCNYPAGVFFAPDGVTPGTTTGPATGGLKTCFGSATGNKTPFAPKFTGTLGTTYTASIGEQGALRTSLIANYNSGFFYEPDNLLRQKSYTLINGTIEYRPSPNWGIEIWGKNITNKAYYLSKQATVTGPFVTLNAPRTYGIDVKFNF